MPATHSNLYNEHIDENRNFKKNALNALIKDAPLPDLNADGSSPYDALADLLRETNDAQFGIISSLNIHNEWVRDATNATALASKTITPDSPVIEANNALLRCLSRLRPIDYAIGQKLGVDGDALRKIIKNDFADTFDKILAAAQDPALINDQDKLKQIKKLENKFNTTLVHSLHQANMTKGCETQEDAEKLLFHYRNLSSLLEPARTMITLTYDEVAGVFQRETQYPVTKKTDIQKQAIYELAKIQPYPFSDEKNAHNSGNIATQEADSLFTDLMADDTRALSAQARKTHLVGAKNAFIVKNELVRVDGELPEDLTTLQGQPADTLWLARTGVPVYVGKGEKNESIQRHTQENLEQIRNTAAALQGKQSLKLHVTCLNTYSPLENQMTMINHLYKATRNNPSLQNEDNISYLPTNPDGTFRMLDIAPNLFTANPQLKPSGIAPLQKSTRLESVAAVMLEAASNDDTLSVVNCASGQDRTGTAVEKATQTWMQTWYHDKGHLPDNIDKTRAAGGNAAEITSHHIHGSPGMKTDSMANNAFGSGRAFSKDASSKFYLASAKTNKKNTVDEVDFLKKPSPSAVAEYQLNYERFQQSLDNYNYPATKNYNAPLHQAGLNVLNNVNKIAGKNPDKLDAQGLADLNSVLVYSNSALTQPKHAIESSRRLAGLSQEVSGKTSAPWKALGAGLLTLACLAIVVGIVAAIPTGGASLFLTVAGVLGLSGTSAAVIGATATAGTALAGAAIYKAGSEKGLARSITQFRNELKEIKDEPAEDDDRDHELSLKI